MRLHIQTIFIDERPDDGVVYGDPGPCAGREAAVQVLELLDVQHNVEAHDRPGQGGGPEVLIGARHVGVEGPTISKPGAELRLKVTKRELD